MKNRILIVDDSPFIRRLLQDWIKAESDMEVVGTAGDGNEAIELAQRLKPDLITLDVEMPNTDGIAALETIMKTAPTAVLMVSSVTTQGATATLKALELGAIDFFPKPQSSSSIQFAGSRDELITKIRACIGAKGVKAFGRAVKASVITGTSDKVVVIASSTGGPRALASLWSTLPKGFPAAILITQHMPAGFTESLSKRLDSIGTVPCREAKPGDKVTPGQAFLAPGGDHMLIGKGGELIFTKEAPLHGVRPAADYLFRTAADIYGRRVLGVVLTGMGRDGAEGSVEIRSKGGIVYAESESTCTIYGMPKAAFEAGGVDAQFPLHELGAAITAGIKEKIARAS